MTIQEMQDEIVCQLGVMLSVVGKVPYNETYMELVIDHYTRALRSNFGELTKQIKMGWDYGHGKLIPTLVVEGPDHVLQHVFKGGTSKDWAKGINITVEVRICES